ncbi:hypothetical protein RUM43_003586 [Polyplax serrata]|uniref:MAGE domain-containing protein n=1 Tax=Polyplax serrata TaxID=468196 RepID=A0AAN8RX84_POLSC
MEVCIEDENHGTVESLYVNDVVKIILILDHSKKPFKQSDILKFMSDKPDRKAWPDIFKYAKDKLNEMGLTLNKTNSNSFFVSNNHSPLNFMHQYAMESEVADRTLLMLILALIFMMERPVTDAELFSHFQQLQIYSTEKPVHPYFGDVKKKLMTEFISQLYLEKIIDKDMETIHFNWGQRAHAEVSKKSVLEFVCEIGYQGKIQPKNLVTHYAKAMEEEELHKSQEATECCEVLD